MNIGDKILELRKSKGFSQEDIANKLNVSRQTVSKWETNSSVPDADKIAPLCDLFDITTDELLKGVKFKKENTDVQDVNSIMVSEYKARKKFALSLCMAIFLYFISIMWVIFADEVGIRDGILVVVFLGIVALATVIIIYSSIVNKERKKIVKEKEGNPTVKAFKEIMAFIFLIIYLLVSFVTMAWYITWIIWCIYGLCVRIVEIVFNIKED